MTDYYYYGWIHWHIHDMHVYPPIHPWDGCVVLDGHYLTSVWWLRGDMRKYYTDPNCCTIRLDWNRETHVYECKHGNIPSDVNIIHRRHPIGLEWSSLTENEESLQIAQVWDQYLNTLDQEHAPKPAP